MPSYGLNPNGLLDTSAELRGVTRSIEAAVDELNTVVQAYINANTGATQAAFVHAQSNWNAGITSMKEALGSASVRLDDIHDAYKLGDAHGAAKFQGHV